MLAIANKPASNVRYIISIRLQIERRLCVLRRERERERERVCVCERDREREITKKGCLALGL